VLEAIRAALPAAPAGEVWIGDDTAVVAPPPGPLLMTVDTAVEGVHADLSLVGLDDLGWRAVTTAVSDVAAMGGRPDWLLVSVAAPPSTDIEALYRGIAGAADLLGVAVVGGDLSTAAQVMVAVTVGGHVRDGGSPVLRSGAAAGDSLIVTGPLGAAAAGLRLLQNRGSDNPGSDDTDFDDTDFDDTDFDDTDFDDTVAGLIAAHTRPVARLAEGEVARLSGATAMIDLSDGIASDVRRIAEESGVGVRISSVPVAAGATEDEAVCGGDDYELLFAASDDRAVMRAFETAGLRRPWVIGECTADPAELSFAGRPLKDCGWEHPF
jgi:thiamine-monophosphate kinase